MAEKASTPAPFRYEPGEKSPAAGVLPPRTRRRDRYGHLMPGNEEQAVGLVDAYLAGEQAFGGGAALEA
ncbi:MAG: hypothetical protein ACXVRS_12235 [Gaiellaceae bacterium]